LSFIGSIGGPRGLLLPKISSMLVGAMVPGAMVCAAAADKAVM
jgi:hypothetical protein